MIRAISEGELAAMRVFVDRVKHDVECATPGPWRGLPSFEEQCEIICDDCCIGHAYEPRDARLMIAARNDLPQALDYIGRLLAWLEGAS